MPPKTGGAGNKNSPSIFAGSSAQLRLHNWLHDNKDKLKRPDADGGGLALPRSPWSEKVLSEKPHLRDLQGWMTRYGFSVAQIRVQMGYFSGSAMSPTAGGMVDTDDEAEARVLLNLGDITALGLASADEVMNPERSPPCRPGAIGGVHHREFFRENHANVAKYCAAYIDVLAKFVVEARAVTKSTVNERDIAFTLKKAKWTALQIDVASSATADPPAADEDPTLAGGIGAAARRRMRKVKEQAEHDGVSAVASVAHQLDDTVAATCLFAIHAATYLVFCRALNGGQLDVKIPAGGSFDLPPFDSDEAGVVTYLAGWLVYKILKYICANGRGRHPAGFGAAAVVSSGSTKGFEPSTTFDAFAVDFRNRATIAPEAAKVAADAKKLNLWRGEQRFKIVGCDITYPSAGMYAFTNLLEGVCRETFQGAGKTLGPTALLSIQRALLTSDIVMSKFLDVFRSKPQSDLVRFGTADDSRIEEGVLAFFEGDTDEIDRAFGAVEVCDSLAKELLTVVVAAWTQMRGRDVVRSMMADLTAADHSKNSTAFRSAVGKAGGGGKRLALDGLQVKDDDDGDAASISPLAESADVDFDGSTRDALPSHHNGCKCGGWTMHANYCKLDPLWKCPECGLDFQPYYLALTCCNSEAVPVMSESCVQEIDS